LIPAVVLDAREDGKRHEKERRRTKEKEKEKVKRESQSRRRESGELQVGRLFQDAACVKVKRLEKDERKRDDGRVKEGPRRKESKE